MKQKSNTKKALSKILCKTASLLKIKFIDHSYNTLLNELANSVLFKVYIKSMIKNKPLRLNYPLEIQFLSKTLSYVIYEFTSTSTSTSINENQVNEVYNAYEEAFMINDDSEIIIDTGDGEMEKFSSEFEKKLTITSITQDQQPSELDEDGKEILKKLIEKKLLVKEKNNSSILIGMEKEVDTLMKLVKFVFESEYVKIMKTREVSSETEELNKFLYKGVILCGPSGCGKTQMIKHVKYLLQDKAYTFLEINIYKDLIFDPDKDSSVKFLRAVFKFAHLLAPSFIIIEDLDVLFPNTDEDSSGSSSPGNKLLYSFIEELDQLFSHKTKQIFLIATCSQYDKIHPHILKCGRLDYSITFTSPNQIQRKNLLTFFSQNFSNSLSDDDLTLLSDKSHGFLAGDIVKLFKEAAIMSIDNQHLLTRECLEECMKNIKPINLKDIIIDVPKVLWSDIGGNREIIKKIRQSIEWPLKNPEAFKRIGISPPNGTLLYGPPGCSKTMIAKALATESGLNFFAVKGPELFSKYVGDTEKAVRDIFKKAKISSPSIIFFDEIDSMAVQRGSDSVVSDKVLCQLLNEMDGIEGREKVVIFGATNRPDILDKALIRPGRFDRLIYLPPPDLEARVEIFKINLSKMTVGDDVKLDELAEATYGFSGADISKICREAGMYALSENISAVDVPRVYFNKAIASTAPSITKEMIDFFEAFSKKNEI